MTRVSITRQINVRDPSARPAWRNALAQWQWVELAGTAAFSGAKPTDTRYGAANGRLDAWNGFAVVGKSVYIAGMGGHTDYSGNEAYELDLDVTSPTWVMLREPSAWEDRLTDTPYYADGRPNASHLYYSLWGIGGNIFRLGNGSHWSGGQTLDAKVQEFRIASNDWVPAGTWPDLPTNLYYYAASKDPRDESIYWCGGNQLYRRDAITGVSTSMIQLPQNASATTYRASAVDTTRNRFVIFGDAYRSPTGGLVYDITADTISTIDFSSADANAMAQTLAAYAGHSAWYDATLDRFIVKTGSGSTIYLVHPTTWVVTAQTTSGGGSISNAVNGIFNKFVQVTALGGIFYQPNHASNGWFLATE